MTEGRKGAVAYDIVICGGSSHFENLRRLLPRLHPHGRVHLASTFLGDDEIAALAPFWDVVHRPRHDESAYLNFDLFCVRDINRLIRAPHFIKLDADVELSEDWLTYVDVGLARHPDAVLFGPQSGRPIELSVSGALVEQVLGRAVHVRGKTKVIGGFYVGSTAFFRRHDRLMQNLHELFFCFRDGRRIRPSPRPEIWPGGDRGEIRLGGVHYENLQQMGNEDVVRNLTVYTAGAGDRLHVVPAGERIRQQHWQPAPDVVARADGREMPLPAANRAASRGIPSP